MEGVGHVDSFTDPMVDCTAQMRYRADHLFYAHVLVDGKEIGCVSLLESEKMESEALEMAQALNANSLFRGNRSHSSYGHILRLQKKTG